MMKKVSDILKEYNNNCRPLQLIKLGEDKDHQKRINLVTDSIGADSLLGGVATALIFVTLLCNKNNWKLRIITRTTACDPVDYKKFLKYQQIEIPQNGVEYVSDCVESDLKIKITDQDVFMATSWWSAQALLSSDYIKHIIYIIQEEETFFYPYGDMHLWCKAIMNDDRIDYIVNSKLLFDYLKNEKYGKIIENGMHFEPAFPEYIYHPDEETFSSKKRYKLFFYGRPNNPRNLFYHGLEFLEVAIQRHIIDTDIWDIYMAGGAYPDFEFSNGYKPIINGRMSWEKYAQFARQIDVSFSLMYTPHPSYPPFDMLCSGAVVLTNNFANKNSLDYSSNLIMADLNEESILTNLEKAIKLAKNMENRKQNYHCNNINREWGKALDNVIEYISKCIEDKQYV